MQRSLSRTATLALAAFSLIFASFAAAQTISGEITGLVTDPQGQVVAGADVTLTNQNTGVQLVTKADNSGLFTFPALPPGTYRVSVRYQGFKDYEKHDLHLSAAERLSAGTLKLEVGSVTETVDVVAQGAPIQTQSAERSALLDSNEITSLMTPGRDVLA